MGRQCPYIKPFIMGGDYGGVVEKSAQHIFAKYEATPLPDISIIKTEILNEINENIAVHNGMDKSWSWKHISSLPNAIVAAIIKRYYIIANIGFQGTDSKDYTFLGIYQKSGENKGLYVESADDLNRIIYKINPFVSDSDIKEIIRVLKDTSDMKTVNTDKDLIAVDNGIFDYKAKRLIPFSPDYIFTVKCRVAYNPMALKSPVFTLPNGKNWDFDSWLADLFDDDELMQLMWEIIGMCIRVHNSWNVVVFFYSTKGMNGKGTLCSFIEEIIGKDACASIPLDCFSNDAYLEKLVTANAVIAHENNTNDISKAKNLKALITGDAIFINRKYKPAIRLSYTGAILQCCNALPRVNDQTDSWYRRVLIVPFPKTFRGEEVKEIKNEFLKDKQVKEYVVCKVLNMNYYKLSEPKACTKMLDVYKGFNDPVRSFLEDVLPRMVWNFIPQGFLYELYKSWYSQNNPGHAGSVLGRNKFFIMVKAAIEMDYSNAWKYEEKRYDSMQIAALAQGPEPMIAEYSIKSYMANYKGADMAKLCTPDGFPKSAGLLRIKRK